MPKRPAPKWRAARSEPAWRRPKVAQSALAQAQADAEVALERTAALQEQLINAKGGSF